MDGFPRSSYVARLAVATETPIRALRAIVELRETLDRMEVLVVRDARRNGLTWTEIGDALGVSRQAAHTRHRLRVKPTDGVRPRPRA